MLKNILITGGAGFIGSNIALKLIAQGRNVTVLDNLTKQIHGENPEERIPQLCQECGLKEIMDKNISELSRGNRQRVALARAIVREPKVFLMDEPLSNLDAKLRLKMRVEIRKLQQKLGITTLFVTHDQEEALTMLKNQVRR